MRKNVLNYAVMDAIMSGNDPGRVGRYWKDNLDRLTRFIEPLEPKSATIYLNLANNSGEGEILCFHPNVPGAMAKNVGSLKSPNIVNNVYDAAKVALGILKSSGYR